MLEFRQVLVKDTAGATLLESVDLALGRGETLVLFGPSGSGKRALLKMAAGILRPAAGTVELRAGAHSCPVGYVLREGGLLNNVTLLQNVALPLVYHRKLPMGEALEKARVQLAELGVKRAASLRPAAAPIAARRLAQFARALLVEPALYLLESPLDDLDAGSAVVVRELLERIRASDEAAAIVATGGLSPYLDWGDRFLMLRGSEVRWHPNKAALLQSTDPELKLYLG